VSQVIQEGIGIAYLEDPKKMQPKQITTTTVKISAFSGSLRVGWTVAKKREAGRPPSLQGSVGRHFPGKRDLPGESVDHATAGCHNAEDSKNQTYKREPITN
jgi:hypothetical protein